MGEKTAKLYYDAKMNIYTFFVRYQTIRIVQLYCTIKNNTINILTKLLKFLTTFNHKK